MAENRKHYFILTTQQNELTPAGTLWKKTNQSRENTLGGIQCQGLDVKGHTSEFPHGAVKALTPKECNLLYGVSDYQRRLEIIRDDVWLQEAVKLNVGDRVEVKARTNSPHQKIMRGTIRYKGSLPDYPGHHFGVDLLPEFHGQGSTDGVFRKKRLFICKPNCGLFVNMYKVRCITKDREKILARSLDSDHVYASDGVNHLNKPSDHSQSKAKLRPVTNMNVAPDQDIIKAGERVVWYSDEGPEPGVVKKVVLMEHENLNGEQLVACVELDNPRGSGTGYYNGQKIFEAKHGHASFIPILGLVREKDLYNLGAAVLHKRNSLADDSGMGLSGEQTSADSPVGSPYLDNHLEEDGGPNREPVLSQKFKSEFRKGRVNQRSTRQQKSKSLGYESDLKGPSLSGLEPGKVDLSEPVYSSSASQSAQKHSSGEDIVLEVGSKAEVLNPPQYGVIRWIGSHPDVKHILAGLEMEIESPGYTDGTFKEKKFFDCPPKRAFFIYYHNVRPDSRVKATRKERRRQDFGPKDSPPVEGVVIPKEHVADIASLCGQFMGIQGYHNSCYLDATLFAMFTFTTVFDQILHCPLENTKSSNVQKHLKVMIVNPLRKCNYVRADKIMTLRIMLSKLVDMEGLTSQEKDPEEFLTVLFRDVLQVEPFLNFSSGQSSYFLQLFLEHDATIQVPTVQQLMERTCMQSNIKLNQTPSVLVLQMPRFGSSYKMYDVIFPSPQLDITDILEFAPRQCGICGSLAEYECLDCFSHLGDGLDKTAFCEECAHRMHRRSDRNNHKPRQIRILDDYLHFVEETKKNTSSIQLSQETIRREIMELFAIVCIKTSHYIAFVRAGSGPNAQWVFFDSMADRFGDDRYGYNIPEVKHCPQVQDWLRENPDNIQGLADKETRKHLPELRNRFMCDAYLCFYQNADSMMYQ